MADQGSKENDEEDNCGCSYDVCEDTCKKKPCHPVATEGQKVCDQCVCSDTCTPACQISKVMKERNAVGDEEKLKRRVTISDVTVHSIEAVQEVSPKIGDDVKCDCGYTVCDDSCVTKPCNPQTGPDQLAKLCEVCVCTEKCPDLCVNRKPSKQETTGKVEAPQKPAMVEETEEGPEKCDCGYNVCDEVCALKPCNPDVGQTQKVCEICECNEPCPDFCEKSKSAKGDLPVSQTRLKTVVNEDGQEPPGNVETPVTVTGTDQQPEKCACGYSVCDEGCAYKPCNPEMPPDQATKVCEKCGCAEPCPDVCEKDKASKKDPTSGNLGLVTDVEPKKCECRYSVCDAACVYKPCNPEMPPEQAHKVCEKCACEKPCPDVCEKRKSTVTTKVSQPPSTINEDGGKEKCVCGYNVCDETCASKPCNPGMGVDETKKLCEVCVCVKPCPLACKNRKPSTGEYNVSKVEGKPKSVEEKVDGGCGADVCIEDCIFKPCNPQTGLGETHKSYIYEEEQHECGCLYGVCDESCYFKPCHQIEIKATTPCETCVCKETCPKDCELEKGQPKITKGPLSDKIQGIQRKLGSEQRVQKITAKSEVHALAEKIKCMCSQVEEEVAASHQLAKDNREFQVTSSRLKTCVDILKEKCRTKDALIDSLKDELKLHANSTVFADMLNKIAHTKKDVEDYDKIMIANYLTDAKSFAYCSCDKGPGTSSSPLEITEMTRVSSRGMLVKWVAADSLDVIGYEVCVEGTTMNRVFGREKTATVLDNVEFGGCVNVCVYALSKGGRCHPAATAQYKIVK